MRSFSPHFLGPTNSPAVSTHHYTAACASERPPPAPLHRGPGLTEPGYRHSNVVAEVGDLGDCIAGHSDAAFPGSANAGYSHSNGLMVGALLAKPATRRSHPSPYPQTTPPRVPGVSDPGYTHSDVVAEVGDLGASIHPVVLNLNFQLQLAPRANPPRPHFRCAQMRLRHSTGFFARKRAPTWTIRRVVRCFSPHWSVGSVEECGLKHRHYAVSLEV